MKQPSKSRRKIPVIQRLSVLIGIAVIGAASIYGWQRFDVKRYDNQDFTLRYAKSTALWSTPGGNSLPKDATSFLLDDAATNQQLLRIEVLDPSEFSNMDTQAAAEASYHLNKRVSHYSQSFKVLNVAFGQINKISIGGKTAYSYTMSSSEPFVFYSDFQLATGSQLDHGGGYGGFMLGGVDGGITSIEVDFVKASSGRLLLIVGTTSDARTQQTIRSLSVK